MKDYQSYYESRYKKKYQKNIFPQAEIHSRFLEYAILSFAFSMPFLDTAPLLLWLALLDVLYYKKICKNNPEIGFNFDRLENL